MVAPVKDQPRDAALQPLRWACQTYTWQMDLPRYRGRIDHIARVAAAAGYTGLEPEVLMLGEDWTTETLLAPLRQHGLALAALCLVEDWQHERETAEEAARADRAISAVAAAQDGAILTLCQNPGRDRYDVAVRQHYAIRSMTAVAARAARRGVHCSVHPNSPAGSLFRTAEDYDVLLSGLPEDIGYTPDVGHIAAAGLDPLTVLDQYRDRVDHIHFKDVTAAGGWARTGDGIIDFEAIIGLLTATGYAGWIVMEDESPQAAADPDAAAAHTASYTRTMRRHIAA